MRRAEVVFLGFGALCAAAIAMSAASCQSDDSSSSSAGPGSTGTGTGGNAASTSSGGGSGTTSSGTAGGGAPAMAATIVDINKPGGIGDKVAVELKGVVAMSHKFFVVQSKSGSCLWGVYLSDPGLSETAANTGILAVSYGTDAATGDAGTAACPTLGSGPVGDAIPDDVKPGDVLHVVGTTTSYTPNCASQPPAENPSQLTQRQLVVSNKTPIDKMGSGPVPAPHTMAADDVAKLASPTEEAFHKQWAGVKVRVGGPISPTLQNGKVVGAYGNIDLQGSNLQVGDKLYYQKGSMDKCHQGPNYPNPNVAWNRVDGFSTKDYCTWSLQPANKCVDFDPPDDDCKGNLTCP